MAENEKVTLTRAAWSEQAEAELMPAAFGDMPIVKAQTLAGECELFRLGGCASGWLITRQEGRELVLVMGAGTNARAVIHHCLVIAKKHNLTVRAHIRRAGMKRIYERVGFRVREVVMGA